MRIGFEAKRVYHNHSGLGNYSRNLVRMLAQHLPQNDYLLFNPRQGSIPFGEGNKNIIEIRPTLDLPIYRDIWRQSLMSKEVQRQKVDIFHGLSMEIPRGLKKFNIPSVVTVHDLIFFRFPQLYKPLDRAIYRKKLNYAVNNADIISATSHQTKQDLQEFLGVEANKIKVHYQGVNPIYWCPSVVEELRATAKKYQLPEKFALFVGTLEERKGVKTILEAQRETKVPVVYVGRPTPYWEELMKNSRYKEISKIITPLRVRADEELKHIYSLAHFFIYPSIFEGFGIPVLEAQVCGTPVITSNNSSLAEVAGPDAVTLDPGEQQQVSEAMQQAWLQDKPLATDASQLFLKQFKEATLASQWATEYEALRKE